MLTFFLNNYLSEILSVVLCPLETFKYSRGKNSDAQVYRAGRVMGPIGKALAKVHATTFTENYITVEKEKETNLHKDVHFFIKHYQNEKLFKHILGKEHASFLKYPYDNSILYPSRIKAKLLEYSKKLDT